MHDKWKRARLKSADVQQKKKNREYKISFSRQLISQARKKRKEKKGIHWRLKAENRSRSKSYRLMHLLQLASKLGWKASPIVRSRMDKNGLPVWQAIIVFSNPIVDRACCLRSLVSKLKQCSCRHGSRPGTARPCSQCIWPGSRVIFIRTSKLLGSTRQSMQDDIPANMSSHCVFRILIYP